MSDNALEKDYSDDSFWDKVKNYAKYAGEAALEPALKMYYAATDSDTPTWAKNHHLWCARLFHLSDRRHPRHHANRGLHRRHRRVVRSVGSDRYSYQGRTRDQGEGNTEAVVFLI